MDLQALWTMTMRMFRPPERKKVSEWAEENILLPGESGAERGHWRNSRAPYQVEVMDALNEPGVEKIVIVAGSQTGKTAVILNMMIYIIDEDPGPMMYVQPTKDTVKDFSTRRVAPMIANCPSVALKVAEAKSRDSSNTLYMKTFPGGSLALTGANSPAELASRPIRFLFLDEVDRFPESAGSEGDPVKLATARTKTFYNKKIIECSTPTDEHSRIEEEYSRGTQEEWQKECPGCKTYVHLVWEQFRYEYEEYQDKQGKTQFTVKWILWECPHCQGLFKESVMKRASGKWVVHNPKAQGVRSFRFNSMTSPWNKWKDVLTEFLEAGTNEMKLKPFYNTTLGVMYDKHPETDGMPEKLYDRREMYGDGVDVPQGVIVLTMGVDTQDYRLEYEIVGWGFEEESWGIAKGAILGRPDEPHVWQELDKLLEREWRLKNGKKLSVAVAFIDIGGHYTTEVYKACYPRKRTFPIKGVPGMGKELVARSKTLEKYRLLLIGVDGGKEAVQYAAGVENEELKGPRYCHWPDNPLCGYDLDYFKGLYSEQLKAHSKGGRQVLAWERVGSARNEPLDMRNYARAAFKYFNWPLKDWAEQIYGQAQTKPKVAKSNCLSRGIEV